jgi:hypothetical protein
MAVHVGTNLRIEKKIAARLQMAVGTNLKIEKKIIYTSTINL